MLDRAMVINMRAQTAGALLLLCALVPLWIGCHKPSPLPWPPSPAPKKLGHGGACARDDDCDSDFCDRGSCVDWIDSKTVYRQPCGNAPTPPPVIIPPGNPRPPEYPMPDMSGINAWDCGGYLCIDDRCRSCASNADCAAHG